MINVTRGEAPAYAVQSVRELALSPEYAADQAVSVSPLTVWRNRWRWTATAHAADCPASAMAPRRIRTE